MITLEFTNGNSYQVKNSWEELSTSEFLTVLDYLAVYRLGGLSILQLRTMVFLLLAGLKPRLHRLPEKADRQSENIYHLAFKINFMLCVKYENEKGLRTIKKEVRELLHRYLPEELEQTFDMRIAERLKKQVLPDLVFARNLVPVIGRRRHKLNGYTFNLDGKILSSSLTAEQFVDAQNVAADVVESSDDKSLDLLVAILYCPGEYSSKVAHDLSKKLAWLKPEIKKAILVNFSAIQEFLYTRTKYHLLFNDSGSSKKASNKKSELGLNSAVHSLIKAGYANIKTSSVIDFFETMYSEIITNVTSLHRQGIELDKIAEQTGLSITKINQIL